MKDAYMFHKIKKFARSGVSDCTRQELHLKNRELPLAIIVRPTL